MVFAGLCLTCDQPVVPKRHGNLVGGSGLRARIERVVGGGVGGTPRCMSLCEQCENALDTIEEYYRHVDNFRETFAQTLSKYGETLTVPEQHAFTHVEGGDVAPGPVVPSTWTICLQAGDGSLVPLQQGATPLVMAEDHQVVLETVTVESTETHQSLADGPVPDGEPVVNTDDTSLHPSILDHTGMALPNEDIAQLPNEAPPAADSPPPKPFFVCARCNAQFQEADDLVTHERTEGHLGSYNYKCGVCGNVYARLDSLHDHMCRHTGEKPHQCNVCGEAFSFRNQLSRHRTTHYTTPQQTKQAIALTHTDGDAVFINNTADGRELITSSSDTKKNMGSELQNMLSSCEFQMVDNMMGGVSVVAQELLSPECHTCPKCHEMFTSRTALQKHQCPAFSSMLKHTKFACPQCSATFCKRSLLERHRCPSLVYRPAHAAVDTQQSSDTVQLDIGEDSSKSTPELPETTDTMARHDKPSVVEAAVGVDREHVLENNQELTEEDQTLSHGPFECDGLETSSSVATSTEKILIIEAPEDSQTIGTTGESSRWEEGVALLDSQAAPATSTTRRSHRTAGKVNPILEMLKKKHRTKAILEEHKTATDAEGVGKECRLGVAAELAASPDGHRQLVVDAPPVVPPPEEDAVTDGQSQLAPLVSDNQGNIEVKMNSKEEMPVVKRKRGRPPKNCVLDAAKMPKINYAPKRARGRPSLKRPGIPPKRPISPECQTDVTAAVSLPVKAEITGVQVDVNAPLQTSSVKRKRGRPRKTLIKDSLLTISEQCEVPDNGQEELDISASHPVKRKPGRPRKVSMPELVLDELQQKEIGLEEEVGKVKDEGGEEVGEGEKENRGVNGRPRRAVKKKVFVGYSECDTDSENESDRNTPESKEEAENAKIGEPVSDEDEEVRESVGRKGERRSKSWSKFKCNTCDRYFSSQIALDKHKTTTIHKRSMAFPVNRKFVCKVCGRGFMKLEHLRDHGVNHSSEKRFECVVCRQKFKFRSQLALHRNSAHSAAAVAEAIRNNPMHKKRYRNSHPPPGDDEHDPKYQPELLEAVDGDGSAKYYRCKNCMMVFSELRLFNRHIISHFSVKPFKCEICSKEFARADTLRVHKKVHYYGYQQTESGAFLCDTCGRQFAKAESLRNHVKMHFGQRPWSCEVCGKGFLDKYTLSRHVVIHQMQKPWLCATCGRGFNRRSHLESHEAQHTGKNLYTCEVCQRGFSDQGNLGRHMLVHSDARPWTCDVCGDTFKRKGNMDEHELTHNSDRQAVCDVCGARFTTKRYLRIHQLIHSGDRPHKCIVCSATFRQLSALITHRRLHTGDSPYKCLHCDKHFKYYDQWKAHEYAHTDAKPYKCLLCSATYRQAGSLRQHRKVVHSAQKGMVFLCTVCNKTFASTMSLERHMKKVHGAEATLQSLQAIGQEAIGTATRNAAQPPTTVSNIVQITNPQGNIETIELTSMQANNNTANIVQLLNGQTLANLAQQSAISNQVGLQLSDGQHLVHMVGQLQDGGAHLMQVAAGDGQTISIDSMGNLTDHQHNIVVTDQQGTVITDQQGAILADQGTGMADQSGTMMTDQGVVITEEGTVIMDNQGHIITDPQSAAMRDELTVLADPQGAVIADSQGGVVSEHYSSSLQQTVVQITDAQAFVDVVSQMEQTGAHTDTLTPVAEHHAEEQLHEVQTMTVNSDGTGGLSCVVEMPHELASISAINHHRMVSTAGLAPVEIVPIETTVTTLESDDHSRLVAMEMEEAGEAMHQLTGTNDIIGTSDCDIVTETVAHEVTGEEEVVETVSIGTTYDPVPNV